MTHTHDSAFPEISTQAKWDNGPWGDVSSEGGLTKREYFAAMAMQGMLANPSELLTEIHSEGITKSSLAVMFADCLIEALNTDISTSPPSR